MTKLNHERNELRLLDDARQRRRKAREEPVAPGEPLEFRGFIDEQDRMGSALSGLGHLRPELLMQLAKGFDHAFVHGDLYVFKTILESAGTPDERSILLRIFNGLLTSHAFTAQGRTASIEKRGKLAWRPLGVESLARNLASFQSDNGSRFVFSESFTRKLSSPDTL